MGGRSGGESLNLNGAEEQAHFDLEERKGYILIRVSGALATEAEVDRLAAFIADAFERTGFRKLLVDARTLEVPFPDDACHHAWEWIHARRYDQLACVMPPAADLVLTRLNMTGVSSGLPFRAFPTVVDAHRWLDLRLSGVHRRPSSSMIPIATKNSLDPGTTSSEPPPGLASQVATPPPPAAVSSVPPRENRS
jgi:hypothetical protein